MQTIQILHDGDADQRLDKFLKKYFPNIALGGLYKFLRTGKIKVNGKKKDQTYRLQIQDTITLFFQDEEIEGFRHSQSGTPEKQSDPTENPIRQRILYEDEYILIINKPPKMNVHPGDHKTTEVSLIELVHDYLGSKYSTLTFKPSLVHRIDRDTSGCILIAKDKKALDILLWDLQSHMIEKIYHTLVAGIPEIPRDTIRYKLLRIENAQNESKVRVDSAGQSAITHYQILRQYTQHEEKYALLECRIETGRMHQIRVHLAAIGHPILWDRAYGHISLNSFFRRKSWIDRQLLHARRLIFRHPLTKTVIDIEAPYESDFSQLLCD
jgi:RluA family pseudouridine synthase